jgi:hypothetical protein
MRPAGVTAHDPGTSTHLLDLRTVAVKTDPPGNDPAANAAPLATASRRPALHRTGNHIRRAWADLAAGFEEHAWTGKLFMLTSGATLAGTAVGAGFVAAWAIAAAPAGGGRLAYLFAAGMGGIMGFVQWKLLLGVARFRPWARVVGILVSAMGVVSGVGMLFSSNGLRGLAIGIVEGGLAAQFLIYFLRSRDMFQGSTEDSAPVTPER